MPQLLQCIVSGSLSKFKIMKLSLEIIRSYGFEETISKPDWDDVQLEIELPNGLRLSTLTVCNNNPTDSDSLEGLDGFIYIKTKEELDVLISKSFEQICKDVKEEDDNFDINEWL
jgi:hypothetical protein